MNFCKWHTIEIVRVNSCDTYKGFHETNTNNNNNNNEKALTVSAQISQDHMATAFHFLISNLGAARAPFPPFVGYRNQKEMRNTLS